VYRFWGPGDELLYVGKSVRVRTRVLSYFRAPRGDKAWSLVRDAARVEWEYVPNEFGALVREMRLIQRHRPRYNVEHKRKRRHVFLKVTREPAPRILPTSRVADDGARYFGPFPRVGSVGHAVRDLTYVMGLRDCPATTRIFFDDQLEIFGGGHPRSESPGPNPRSPLCLRADLGTCLAPCCGRTSSSEYDTRVEETLRFLEGRGKAPIRRLDEAMADAVRRMDFEYAATVRDRRDRLERLQHSLTAWRGRVESLTFVYRVPGFRGADRLYLIRRGLVEGWTEHPKDPEARERVARRVRAFVEAPPLGANGFTPHQAAEVLLVAAWFRRRERELGRTTPPREWLAGA
jgi:excinuclease ABC subunit C